MTPKTRRPAIDTPAQSQSKESRPVYIVDGARTPFLRARGKPGPFTPVDLAVACGRPLLLRQAAAAEAIDEVILGCGNPIPEEMNPARVAALRLGLGAAMPGWSVQRNCGSGMQSIDAGFRRIQSGNAEVVLAGGTEALSHAPLVFRQEAVEWFGELSQAGNPIQIAKKMAGVRPDFFKPEIGLEKGLTDPVVGLNMGQTAEVLAHLFDISREEADRYAAESHHRLANAQENGWLDEIEPIFDRDGTVYDHDDGVRPDTSLEKLAGLEPAFEKPYGKVTPGNSSQITDGASWVLLASAAAVEKYDLKPLVRLLDSQWAALDPRIMGLGPTLSSTPILARHGKSLADIDLWEINEAFAAQVLACLAAWERADFCRDALGLDAPLGKIDRERMNVDGGAISLGHPVGTSGNRIVLHLAKAMNRWNAKTGIATECIGGGQGGAMLLELAEGGAE